MKIISTGALLILLFCSAPSPAGLPTQVIMPVSGSLQTSGSLIVRFIVSGIVLDDNNAQPVAGARIEIKDGGVATTTAPDGRFSITMPGGAAKKILLCTASGYQQQEMTVSPGSGPLTVRLRLQEELNVSVSNYAMELEGIAAGVITGSSRKSGRRLELSKAAPSITPPWGDIQTFDTEGYDAINENRFLSVLENPVSTFSIDVDAASYSNVRRFLRAGQLPPPGSVRIEELINYFPYHYPQPQGEHPFAVHTEIAGCPWNEGHTLIRIGLQGKKMPVENLPAANLVFLIDVSGSMMSGNKLPLVKSAMKLLTDQLREQDRVSIVAYAGSAGLVLPATSATQLPAIREAIDRLEAGGSTAGGAGIRLAYRIARENLVPGGNNRVILCTDGDFNVGMSSDAAMEKLIEEERASGIYLTVLGYGMGNYKDNKMQKLANAGNGNHAYIDNLAEARKVLVNEFGGTLFTIANDVKLQVEFNPALVQGYRLIGYENRLLRREDFNDDKKDAGELGSGHAVTALYELIPAGAKTDLTGNVDALKYQRRQPPITSHRQELMTIKLRYKTPGEDRSRLMEQPVSNTTVSINEVSVDFRFAAAVAEYGMLLADTEFAGQASFESAARLADSALGDDRGGYRREFIDLVGIAARLKAQISRAPNPE